MFTFLFLISSCLFFSVNSEACKPVQVIMTRAVGAAANYSETKKEWVLAHPLSNVNFASLAGSLKFIISETIDKDTGYAECKRKNDVGFIQFFQVTYCNPDAALSYFSQKRVFNQSSFGDFGKFISFDSGACHSDDALCESLVGASKDIPNLKQFVGWQNESSDERNPTMGSYWYSTPGECPTQVWANKTDECKKKFPTGLCAAGKTPDGTSCTYTYKMLGQVVLDELVGITAIKNNVTGKPFVDATEYCLSKHVEFQRDPTTYEFIQGLPFWKDPLSEEANAKRIEQLLAVYKKNPYNAPIPEPAALVKLNPDCGSSAPNCVADGKITCTRDDQMMCIPCAAITTQFPWDTCGKPATKPFPQLKSSASTKLKKPKTDGSSTEESSSSEDADTSAAMNNGAFFPSAICLLVLSIMYSMYN